jgi:ankyrin repeat protein
MISLVCLCDSLQSFTPPSSTDLCDRAEVIKQLLRKTNASSEFIEVPNSNGRTAMHLAAIWGSEAAARVLIDGGANLFAKDALGLTPAHLAALNNQAAVLDFLLRGKQPSPDDIAAIFNQTFNAETATQRSEDAIAIASATDYFGRSILHAAAYTCSISCCQVCASAR